MTAIVCVVVVMYTPVLCLAFRQSCKSVISLARLPSFCVRTCVRGARARVCVCVLCTWWGWHTKSGRQLLEGDPEEYLKRGYPRSKIPVHGIVLLLKAPE